MNAAPYDIFRKDLLGTPVWMEAVQDLETAELRMMELLARAPGEYLVICQETGEIACQTASTFANLIPKDVLSASTANETYRGKAK
jgi:hypothetical protein